MSGWRPMAGPAIVMVASAVLAVPVGPAQASPPAYRPCPIAKPQPPVNRPPRPSPPAHDPSTVGGEGLATAGLTIPAGAQPPPATLTATSWLVADMDSGEVLGACGPHEYGTPASVQKLLLAETVMPKLSPNQVVKVTQADLNFEPGSSAVGLLLGGSYSVATLWLGLLLNSGNDAANVLARLGGGAAGVKGTVEAMNAEARRLGAYETHAVTPSGLDGPGQFTSAYDLALIARACFARADFRKYIATQRAQMPAQPPKDTRGFQIQNENLLLYQYRGALGGKTGFTNLARHTYVGAAQRNGRRLVVTLLGAEARPLRGWQQGAALLDWGFSLPRAATVGRLVEPGETQRASAAPATNPATPNATADAAAQRASHTEKAWSTTALGGLALAIFALPVVLLVVSMARRRRRAGLRRLSQRQ